ncbi:MAG: hypothetical protein IJ538_00220 [Clostridia bacterium]|nr:hypothetical protein [Clostridia bacterium]
MNNFDEQQLINFKKLSSDIVCDLEKPMEKVLKDCNLLAQKLDEVEKKAAATESLKEIAVLEKKADSIRKELLKKCSTLNRMKKIKTRNENRSAFFDETLKQMGIYKNIPDKKFVSKIESGKVDFGEAEINLNEELGELKFYSGERIKFDGLKIDWSDSFNKEIVISLSDSMLGQILHTNPESVSTISAESLLNTKFKQRLLKQITAFVTDNAKRMTITEINKKLGNLLAFKTEIPENAESYIAGVKNSFNVQVKSYLLFHYPSLQEDISKLKCNERSELVPEEKIIAVFGEGLAGNAKRTEAEVSEEVRLENEEKNRRENDLLMEIANELQEDVETEEIDREKVEQQRREAELKAKELEEQRMQEEQLAKDYGLILSKEDVKK